MQKGQFKVQDLSEIRECTECKKRKIVTEFIKGKGSLYRYRCKECKNAARRTNVISSTRFKVGHSAGVRFQKGHTPWYKIKNVDPPALGKVDHENENRFYSFKYKQWKTEVKNKYNGKCERCGSTNRVAAHHIKPWKDYPDLRFDPENGMSLCVRCHGKEEGFQKGQIPWNKKTNN